MLDPDRKRRSLSQRGGITTRAGDAELSQVLAAALDASASEAVDELTHGFHSYPARMHPAIAAELVAALSQPGESVLDPFVGSGTVLVEALVQGRRGIGVDLNPLALRIAEVRCELRDRKERSRFERTFAQVAEASEERVRTRTPVGAPISRTERAFYEPHVCLELSGLWAEIETVETQSDRRALEVVFSSLLTKFSRQRGDTSEERIKKRIRKGLVTEFFVRKAQELVLRWEALEASAPRDATKVRLVLGDARALPELLPSTFRADLVLTSPPYGGTYDYVEHHARRFAWLGLDDRALRVHEIGARRTFGSGENGPERWDRELGAVLRSIAKVLDKRGRVVLWLGDADVANTRIAADLQIARLAPRAGLTLTAAASQARRDFLRGPERREHLLLLTHAR